MRPRPLNRFRFVCRELRTPAIAASCQSHSAGAVLPATCTQKHVKLLYLLDRGCGLTMHHGCA